LRERGDGGAKACANKDRCRKLKAPFVSENAERSYANGFNFPENKVLNREYVKIRWGGIFMSPVTCMRFAFAQIVFFQVG
jgi:hypothetical protein